MGEAKRRGTFEQRHDAAIKRDEGKQAQRLSDSAPRRQRIGSSVLAALLVSSVVFAGPRFRKKGERE